MPFPEDATASLICIQNGTARNHTNQSIKKNPKMTMKGKERMNEQETGERRERFLLRGLLSWSARSGSCSLNGPS